MPLFNCTAEEANTLIEQASQAAILSGSAPSFVREAMIVSNSHYFTSCLRLPAEQGAFFIVHPKTGSFHKSKTKSNFSAYVSKMLEQAKAGRFKNVWIKNCHLMHPLFVFIWVPENQQDLVTSYLATKYVQQGTAKYSVKTDLFHEAIVQHDSGFSWKVVVQDYVQEEPQDIIDKANLSLRSAIAYYNPPYKHTATGTFGHHFKFFNESNSQIFKGNVLNRRQVFSTKLLRGRGNVKMLQENMSLVVKAAHIHSKINAKVTAIACVTHNNVIGIGNALAIKSKEEMAHFKETTKHSTVIMGRKTWDSLPEVSKPLPDRLNAIVSTRDHEESGAIVFDNLSKALLWATSRYQCSDEVFIIGGATLWKTAFEAGVITKLILTRDCSKEIAPQVQAAYASELVHFDFDKYLKNAYLHTVKTLNDKERDLKVYTYYL